MGTSRSKPSASRAPPPPSEPRSPTTASVLAEETRDGARGSSGEPACSAPSEAASSLRKRLRSALPEDGGCAKRIKDVGKGVVPDTALLNDDCELQRASAEPESLLFSCQPFGASNDMVLGPSGSAHDVQPMSSFKLDGAKYKVFLSHAGAQKDFVEQLCVDLERMGYFFPFFDQRQHSLPKGEDFGPLIIEAARLCHVAVVVLSKEYLCSKWPMIELVEFYGAQQVARGGGGKFGGGKLKFLPLFFKLSIEEVKDEGRWMPKWKEHAARDGRIDLSKWSAAVKALCKSNGLDFGKVARQEVAYRKCVVASIFKLSPPDLLFGSSERMVGCNRMCEAMSTQFVEDPSIGARVLGVYGMAGLGKTMLAKALHDYFYGEYLGKACYIDMLRGSTAKRLNHMLRAFEKDVLDCIGGDIKEGVMQMKTLIKRDCVFLVLDNISDDVDLLQEVQEYLRLGFHPKSRIMLTSRSKAILGDLLWNMELCMPMPTLTVEEASELFFKRAAPMKAICELTKQEQDILGICIQKCWSHSEDGGFYHPVALMESAIFFSRLGGAKENQLLVWKEHLEMEMDLVKDVSKSSEDLYGILGLQFSTFDFSEKLLFLDIALYAGDFGLFGGHNSNDLRWLCRLHDESPTIIMKKLCNLRKSSMIEFDTSDIMDSKKSSRIIVPYVYSEFAKWYATGHNMIGLKNAFGVFQPRLMEMRGDFPSPNNHWSNFIRLRISEMTLANARVVASKRMQELSNLAVLQLSHCYDLTLLNLEGLHCLRDLELNDLPQLKTITLLGNSSKDESASIYNSLQRVRLLGLESLICMPDLRPCTSLYSIVVDTSQKLRSVEGVDCPCLEDLTLGDFSPKHFESLLDFDCLKSLEYLAIDVVSDDGDGFDAEWKQKKDENDVGVEATLEGEGPSAQFLVKLCLYLYKLNSMICTRFVSS